MNWPLFIVVLGFPLALFLAIGRSIITHDIIPWWRRRKGGSA